MYKENCQLFGPRADCIDGECVCNSSSHYIENERFCWIKKRIGDLCESDNDCYVPKDSPRAVCKFDRKNSKNKICSCPQDTRPSTSGDNYCVKNNPGT